MSYKHVYEPVKGLMTATSAAQIPDECSPYLAGIYLKDGEIVSDYGHTAYPTASTTKTNLLNGSFMRADQFLLENGTTRLVAHTTTNAYEYNTTTTTWDCITKGQTIEDCEDAWVASANVTATADGTIKLRGTNSSKLVIAAGFTTGLVAYENFGALNLSTETAAHFWIYSTVALASGDFQFLLDDTNNCASPLELINIPAVTANTWTPICIPYANAGALTAVISVGLKAIVDVGACTIYLDDVRSVQKFTGTSSNLFSTTFMNNTMWITNGVDQPKKYGGTAATGEVAATTTLAAGSITTSEIVLNAKEHLVYFNNTENGADAPKRASWSNIGQPEDLVGGTAGYQDLTDDNSWIIAIAQLSDNQWAVYKEESIVIMDWVGGQTPFRFTTMVRGKTIAGKDCVLAIDGTHYVIGTKDLYTYTGDDKTTHLDDLIKRTLYESVDYNYLLRSFIMFLEEDDEIQFWLPTSTAYPDIVYCLDTVLKIWYRKTRTMTGKGSWLSSTALTLGDLSGTIGSQNFTFGSTISKSNTPIYLVGDSNGYVYKLDKTTLDNNGSAITNEWQSKNFVLPLKDKSTVELSTSTKDHTQFDFFRVSNVFFEAKGQSVTVEYSKDGGVTWNPCQSGGTNTVSLVSSYTLYQLDFDIVTQQIMFRWKNTTVSSGFRLRYFGFKWEQRSSRR